MTSSRKTWISILIAAAIVIGMLAAAVIGGTAFFIYSHTSATFVTPETAARDFAAARARFAGATPLLELVTREPARKDAADDVDVDDDRVQVVVNRTGAHDRRPINSLHVLTFQPRTGKLVNVDIPAWLLQLSSVRGHLRLASLDALQGDNERVTLDDLERHGPGLILDLDDHRGTRVLIWTE